MIPEMYLRPGMAMGDCGGFTSRAIRCTYSMRMEVPKQKNFYDNKRQFQGKDHPTDPHPAPQSGMPSRGSMIFALLLLAALAAIFWMREKSARDELAPGLSPKAPPAGAPAKPAH